MEVIIKGMPKGFEPIDDEDYIIKGIEYYSRPQKWANNYYSIECYAENWKRNSIRIIKDYDDMVFVKPIIKGVSGLPNDFYQIDNPEYKPSVGDYFIFDKWQAGHDGNIKAREVTDDNDWDKWGTIKYESERWGKRGRTFKIFTNKIFNQAIVHAPVKPEPEKPRFKSDKKFPWGY
jgi:hypothetical protein